MANTSGMERKPLSEILSPMQKEDIEPHRKVWEALRGPKGEDGKDGKDGKDGEKGKDGRDGRDGYDGLDGDPGPRGSRGEKGEVGEKGEKGEKGDPGPRGPKGEKGDSGDKGESGKDGKNGKNGSPDKPDDIIEKIHASTLTIKPEKIEGFSQFANDIATAKRGVQKMASMAGPTQLRVKNAGTPLGNIETINFSGMTITPVGDGREITVASSGSSGTNVWNEVVSGSGTTFTLAHTPQTGTLRLYAEGQRLIPTTDYSLSGATITTNSSWATGVILADYTY